MLTVLFDKETSISCPPKSNACLSKWTLWIWQTTSSNATCDKPQSPPWNSHPSHGASCSLAYCDLRCCSWTLKVISTMTRRYYWTIPAVPECRDCRIFATCPLSLSRVVPRSVWRFSSVCVCVAHHYRLVQWVELWDIPLSLSPCLCRIYKNIHVQISM